VLRDLFSAVALVLVLEGILPFVTPETWRRAMLQAASLDNRVLRVIGAMSMLAGLLLLYVVR